MRGAEEASGTDAANSIILTGASGFIGSRLLSRLVDAGAEVHAVSRDQQPQDGVCWWRIDLSDRAAVQRMVASVEPHAIVHLASRVSGKRSLELVRTTLESNVLTTVNLLTAAVESDCHRVVVTGTMVEPDDRAGPGIAGSPYAMSKWASSSYARMFHALYALPVVILRVFMVYGPGQSDSSKLIPHTILSLLRGEAPKVSSGGWELDWIYIDDVVEAYVAALQASGVEGETVDVGSGQLVSMRDVLEQIAKLVDATAKPQFGAVPDRPFEVPRRADITRTASLLDWAPETSLEQGLRTTVDWYREQHADAST